MVFIYEIVCDGHERPRRKRLVRFVMTRKIKIIIILCRISLFQDE